MSYAIRAFGLTKRFRRTAVLEGFDLDVPEGSIYALTGRNGAGKTTAIKILMNILAPSGGQCEVLGADSRQLCPAELAQIGYVSENQAMPDWMTRRLLPRISTAVLSQVRHCFGKRVGGAVPVPTRRRC